MLLSYLHYLNIYIYVISINLFLNYEKPIYIRVLLFNFNFIISFYLRFKKEKFNQMSNLKLFRSS